jgi:hypothetical protein
VTDAPEKIWRWAVQNCGGFIEYSDFPVISEHAIEYTRTDVTDARIEELQMALLECREEIEGLYQDAAGASL